MLKIYNASGAFVKMISDTDYQDAVLTKTLADGDKQLEFVYSGDPTLILNEYYVETAEDRFVVKEVHPGNRSTQYVCKLDLEALEEKVFTSFTAVKQTITQAATAALSGTGWTVSTTITKKRSVQCIKMTPLEVLYKIRDAFMCEIQFDTINHVVYFKTQIGSDKGVYLRTDVNLRSLTPVYDSYEYYTRLIPIGADGLEIDNDGKNYVENYSYSNKIRVLIWEDTSYDNAADLMADATAKLADLAVPKRSYSADVIDLARIRQSVLAFDLGDTIKLTDDVTRVMEKQRIVKIVQYLDNPERNTVELSNTVLTWEEQQARLKAAADAWSDISNPDGSVNGVYVHGVQSGDVVNIEVTTGGSTVKKNLQEAVTIMQTQTSSAATSAANAQTTADGKNTVIYSTSQPSTSGRKAGDVWFDTDDGYKMYRYTGSAWSASQFGQNAIAANSITANHIVAGAVTAAKISVGSLSAINADMGTITAGKIQVSTTIDGVSYTGVLRTSGGAAASDGGLRMFEIYKTESGTTTSQFYISTGGRLYALNAYVKGEVQASSGWIGGSTGWQIGSNSLKSTSGGLTTGLQTPASGTIALAIGASLENDWSSAKFLVNHTGALRIGSASPYFRVNENGVATIPECTLTDVTFTLGGIVQTSNSEQLLALSSNTTEFGGGVTDMIVNCYENTEITGTLTTRGNVHLNTTGTKVVGSAPYRFRISTSDRACALQVGDTGNYGLYDITNNQWTLYSDTSGYLNIPVTTRLQATTYLSNNVFLQTTNTGGQGLTLIGMSDANQIWVGAQNFARRPDRLILAETIDKIYVWNSSGVQTLLSTAVSDRRLKHDIEDLRNAKKFIMALRPKQFKLNGGDGSVNFGFIAQDVRPVLEETYDGDSALLAYNGDHVDRYDESTFHYSMDYTQLIAPIVSMIQDMERRLIQLEDKA